MNILGGLISGKISMRKSLGGPVMIARAAGESARGGIYSLLMFIAFLSVNLGVLNLLPIPVLDGGHLVFLGAEALRGRPLSLRVRLVATQVGMAFLILMMIYVTYNDVVRWFF
jgi:regulator of sigma E protease